MELTRGHINPMLGTGVRNTRTEQVRTVTDLERTNFQIKIDDNYIEDIVKGTYIKSQTVYQYFLGFAQNQNQKGECLQSQEFSRAIQALGIGWTLSTTENVFAQLDTRMNEGRRMLSVTPMQIDEAICLACKRPITQMQDDVLKSIAEQAIQRDKDVGQLIKQSDLGNQKLISIDALCDVVLNKMKVPSLDKTDVIFLAKKYMSQLANHVQYE